MMADLRQVPLHLDDLCPRVVQRGDPAEGLAQHGEEGLVVPVGAEAGHQHRNGNTIEVHYRADGSPSELVHHGGYRIGVTTASGRVTALTLLSAPDQPQLLAYEYDNSVV